MGFMENDLLISVAGHQISTTRHMCSEHLCCLAQAALTRQMTVTIFIFFTSIDIQHCYRKRVAETGGCRKFSWLCVDGANGGLHLWGQHRHHDAPITRTTFYRLIGYDGYVVSQSSGFQAIRDDPVFDE